eukprot:CAMPEP_0117031272 /NCGR_PEP_ID=MMETSP0472-20121206/22500_1 /TAXON_ID=693140 ORGANISM="Tiarina fusus, Strain LIS" /NCGR_SAMPLE_ID=MMETSP0472 /ASSEMBLY_ACC=CAM_ASM_000603 /LENGTH=114 /DNA_ID=CAMNT_0004739571 /DNA_START=17 /DNA_END=362 /DNA_ORIENTATION=-
MKIIVRTLGSGEENKYEVDENCTTGMLKELIHEQSGISPELQELRHAIKNGTQIRKLCYEDLPLEKLQTMDVLSLDLVYKLGGGDDDEEYGPSPTKYYVAVDLGPLEMNILFVV